MGKEENEGISSYILFGIASSGVVFGIRKARSSSKSIKVIKSVWAEKWNLENIFQRGHEDGR